MDLNPFKVYSFFDFTSEDFSQNQTTCMAYNANTLKPEPWVSNDCLTSYTDRGIVCDCASLNNFYYAIVNDFSRAEIWEAKYEI